MPKLVFIENVTLLGAYRSLGWLLTIPIVLVGGFLGFLQLRDALSLPNVALIFARPDDPVFWIANRSSKVVREPKYEFLLFDMSVPGVHEPYLLLQIRPTPVDPIRPGRVLGPAPMQFLRKLSATIENGHHIFGFVFVDCQTCKAIRYYWVFVHVGTDWWYAEVPANKINSILPDLKVIVYGGPDYLSKIEKLVPSRRPISMRATTD